MQYNYNYYFNLTFNRVQNPMSLSTQTQHDLSDMNQKSGNYTSYYSKRRPDDNRVENFKDQWFRNLKCLDIGCNSGMVTTDVARKFNPASILGVDNDEKLILTAQKLLEGAAKLALQSVGVTTLLPRSMASAGKSSSNVKDNLRFPGNVSFVLRDFMSLVPDGIKGFRAPGHSSSSKPLADINPATHPQAYIRAQQESQQFAAQEYDTVLCLSITKWVHLYHGDNGLVLFFSMLNNLMAGESRGVLVLEYQPWSSYIKNKSRTDTTKANFNNIRIKPSDFVDLLTTFCGFSVVTQYGGGGIGSVEQGSVGEGKGFDRPVVVLRKNRHIAAEPHALQTIIDSVSIHYGGRADTFSSSKRKRTESIGIDEGVVSGMFGSGSLGGADASRADIESANRRRAKEEKRAVKRRRRVAEEDLCAYSRHVLTDSEGEECDSDGSSDDDVQSGPCKAVTATVTVGSGSVRSTATTTTTTTSNVINKNKSIFAKAIEKSSRRHEKKIKQLNLVELRDAASSTAK